MSLAAPGLVRRAPLLAFAGAAVGIVLASRAVVATAKFAAHPGPFAVAVTLDLTLTLCAAFWLTAVRSRALPPLSVVAVFFAGIAVALRVLPPGDRALASKLAHLAGPAEALLTAWLGLRAVRLVRHLRRAGASVPFEDALREAARAALGPYRVADAIASEASVLALALFSWRRAPHVPAGAVAFSIHRRSGAVALTFGLALAGVAEAFAAHVLVQHFSPRVAWILSGLAVYGVLWLAGDARALVLRPVLLGHDALRLRIGLRFTATVALRDVEAVCAGPDAARHCGAVRLSALGPPNLYLHLARPVDVEGPFGLRRRGDCLGVRVDDPAALAAALASRCRLV